MQLAFDIQADASKLDGLYIPGRGVQRFDSWGHASRWERGLYTGKVGRKMLNLLYVLAALATCGLGIWGSVSSKPYSPSTI